MVVEAFYRAGQHPPVAQLGALVVGVVAADQADPASCCHRVSLEGVSFRLDFPCLCYAAFSKLSYLDFWRLLGHFDFYTISPSFKSPYQLHERSKNYQWSRCVPQHRGPPTVQQRHNRKLCYRPSHFLRFLAQPHHIGET